MDRVQVRSTAAHVLELHIPRSLFALVLVCFAHHHPFFLTAHRDEATGHIYYFNSETQESSWEPPGGWGSATPPPALRVAALRSELKDIMNQTLDSSDEDANPLSDDDFFKTL